MRIVYLVTRSDDVGGAQVHVRDLAAAMRRHGHEVWVLAGGGGTFARALPGWGVEYVTLRHLTAPIHPWHDLRAFAELRAALERIRPDLLSTHSTKAGILGRMAGWRLGIPTVFTAHGWAFTPGVPRWKAGLYRPFERLAAPLARRIITVSEFDRELAIRERVADPERLVAIHNGMPDIPAALRADPGAAPARLAMIARFEPQKDHATLIQALAGLPDLPWTLDLIGDGPLLPAVTRSCEEHGLAARIHFRGAVEDVTPLLARAQVYLLISRWEGFPRSILEAMRAGLPVVASAVGGVPEAVEEGKTGYVVPRGDAALLRDRVRRLVSDSALRAKLGASGRAAYEARFTFDRMVERTTAVYGQVLEQRSHRPAPASETSSRAAGRAAP